MTANQDIKKYKQEISQNNDLIKFYYLKRTLLVGMSFPSKTEIKEFNSGKIILRFIIRPNAIFILFKIGILDWYDIAYSYHLELKDKDENYSKKLQESYPKKMNLVLYDVETRDVKVKKVLNLSNEFSEILRDKILEQLKMNHSAQDYNLEINNLYEKYTSKQLALSKLVEATYEIPGLNKKEIREIVYDRYGYNTNKSIPKWIYHHIHNPKVYGLIPKEDIPDDLLRKGVTKCIYKNVKRNYWSVILYKTKLIKKKKRRE